MRGKQFLGSNFTFRRLKTWGYDSAHSTISLLPVFLKYTLVILITKKIMSFFTHVKFTSSVLLLNEKNNFNSQFTIFKIKCKCEVFINFQLFENLGKEVKNSLDTKAGRKN